MEEEVRKRMKVAVIHLDHHAAKNTNQPHMIPS